MARLRSGILGQLRGKVAGVVGGQWKDVNYIREYVKPANPNTTAQQIQRSLMSYAVAFAKLFTGPVFNVYVDKFQKSMSGFNWFIKQNIASFVYPPELDSLLMTTGKLSFAGISTCTRAPGNATINVAFGTGLGSNGLATDRVFACAYDKTLGIAWFAAAEVLRSAASIQVNVSTASSNTDLAVYLWVCRRDTNNNVTIVSQSDYSAVVAP
jgi:hypothetical protein